MWRVSRDPRAGYTTYTCIQCGYGWTTTDTDWNQHPLEEAARLNDQRMADHDQEAHGG
jgi:hypothetical protein